MSHTPVDLHDSVPFACGSDRCGRSLLGRGKLHRGAGPVRVRWVWAAFATLVAVSSLEPANASGQGVDDPPSVVLDGVPFSLTIAGPEEGIATFEVRTSGGRVLHQGTVNHHQAHEAAGIVVTDRSDLPLRVTVGDTEHEVHPTLVPGWYSILPPLAAILMALIFREVVAALFAGVWLGALAVAGFNPFSAFARSVDTFAVPTLADMEAGHTQIIVFTMLLGGMVGVIARNGGTMGIVERVAPWASSRKKGKLTTWAAGLAIFFDDYANTLIVGNTMRPITDKLKISREKLAYIVDSTAAPVAALVPISTWVGYEISLIGQGLSIAAEQQSGDPALAASLVASSPFGVFLHSIPYLFYPILALAFVFLTSFTNRDFGAMATAEMRAANDDGVTRPGSTPAVDADAPSMATKEGAPHRWWNAAVPVLAVILVVVGGLYHFGRAQVGPEGSLMDVFSAADPFASLLWGSLAGVTVGILMSVVQRILTVHEAVAAAVSGIKAMVMACVILTLAWSLGDVTAELGTAEYLAQVLRDALPLQLVPVLVFLTAAAIAFATGTSWTTMAILIPLVIPLVVSLGGGVGFDGGVGYSVLLGAISSVLAGSIWGDHCSPISDTTVLSSTAAAVDHVDHVRTQLPYAVLVAVVGMLLGDIGTAVGLPNWIALVGGVAVLYGVLRVWGRQVPDLEAEV
jgi:Na+/H+ antiporter NhaC